MNKQQIMIKLKNNRHYKITLFKIQVALVMLRVLKPMIRIPVLRILFLSLFFRVKSNLLQLERERVKLDKIHNNILNY